MTQNALTIKLKEVRLSMKNFIITQVFVYILYSKVYALIVYNALRVLVLHLVKRYQVISDCNLINFYLIGSACAMVIDSGF